jgi:hypothetical protein
LCGPKNCPNNLNFNNMETNTIKVVTVPVGDLINIISNVVNVEIEKLVNNPRLGEGFKDEVLDRKQAAGLLKLSEQTLTKLFLEGKVVGQKSGAQYRFLKSAIVNYLSSKNN